jgi:hypothetical protein
MPVAGWLAYAAYARIAWDIPLNNDGWKLYVGYVGIVALSHFVMTARRT